ncbi:MAG: 16S rRNA (guanine(527)-N(7))-methyltransferase RsmG [Bacteroidales bacterium]|nr:16S rRNA (guanine(527)-N(7))-methyltransferase RsmG [Bacteroidales bacterium]
MSAAEFLAFVKEWFPLTPEQEQRFAALEGLYREWNAQINVISRKDIDNVYEHHVLHSLAIARYLQVSGLADDFAAAEVLDLGTGGGFPGIPLAILFPSARFVLCDSVGKKTIVAEAVSKALGLENVSVVHARAEGLPQDFDYVVSRAVASLPDFYPWVKGKFRKGILYLKGGEVNAEISAIMARYRLARGSIHTWRVDSWLPGEWFAGKLVIHIEK